MFGLIATWRRYQIEVKHSCNHFNTINNGKPCHHGTPGFINSWETLGYHGTPGSGIKHHMSILVFKRLVSYTMLDAENKRSQISCYMYKIFGQYDLCITEISKCTWWVFAQKRTDKIKQCCILARLPHGESAICEHCAQYKDDK